MTTTTKLGLAALLISAGACSSDDDPCSGATGKCIAISAGADAQQVQQAFLDVEENGTVAFAAGTYHIDTELDVQVSGVTVKGAGPDKTILSFADQSDGAQGILVENADHVTLTGFAVEDTPGDAIKVLGADGITFDTLRVTWTGGPLTTNGSYGLYPVQCKNVEIANSEVSGASDSGIYVGQSNNILVHDNTVHENVAGIEIENSSHAEVTGNTATKNTGGILVFNLPKLQVEDAGHTLVHDNEAFDNNTENFAPQGNIVGLVPTGTGIAILAAHDVEIRNNNIHDHKTVNIGMISYVPTMLDPNDPTYDQYPTQIHIHDNMLTGASTEPTGPLGALILLGLQEAGQTSNFMVPDIITDGVLDPNRPNDANVYTTATDRICIHGNGDADFMNLHYPKGDATLPSMDLAAYDCTQPALPSVTLP